MYERATGLENTTLEVPLKVPKTLTSQLAANIIRRTLRNNNLAEGAVPDGLQAASFKGNLIRFGEGWKMKGTLRGLFLGVMLSLMMSGSLWAQATAQINGIVKDQSGAVLPGVDITATQ